MKNGLFCMINGLFSMINGLFCMLYDMFCMLYVLFHETRKLLACETIFSRNTKLAKQFFIDKDEACFACHSRELGNKKLK